MGPYCEFCGHRCFLPRVVPADDKAVPHYRGRSLIMATCAGGMEHDRRETGHDHTTAINPRMCTVCGKATWEHPTAECCPGCACRTVTEPTPAAPGGPA